MKKKIVSIMVILALFMVNAYPAIAVTSQEYKNQAAQAQENADKEKEKLEEVEGKLDSALQEVADVSSSIDKVEEEIGELTNQISKLDESIAAKQKDLDEKELLLDERLSAAYMNGSNTYLDALFSGGIVNFVSNYDMIKQIAEYDNNLINEVKEAKASLESEKSKIQEAKTEKEKKSTELKSLKNEKQQKVDALTDEQKEIQNKIDEYDSQMNSLRKKEKEQAAKEAAEAKAAAEKAAAEAKNKDKTQSGSQSGDTGSSNGKFLWPVPSSRRITSPYGYRIHPIYGTKKLHAGIDIGAAGGANIVAADSGTVILSSWGYNGGYGNYVIISHGNGVTTRYAHCSNLYVKVGDKVSRGQAIAAVGSTGASTGNHCHFEVRINGESKQPLNYL